MFKYKAALEGPGLFVYNVIYIFVYLFLYITAFLVTDDHDCTAVQPSDTAHNRSIVSKVTITVQFLEIREDVANVVQRIGTLRVARHLRDLPAAQVAEDALGQGLALLLQPGDLFGDVQRVIAADQTQFFDFGLQGLC